MGIPVIHLHPVELGIHRGPFPTRPLGDVAPVSAPPTGSTKPLCLCNLLRENDEERRWKRNARGGRSDAV